MKYKEERKLQFVLRYYEDGKLDTRKALKKIKEMPKIILHGCFERKKTYGL